MLSATVMPSNRTGPSNHCGNALRDNDLSLSFSCVCTRACLGKMIICTCISSKLDKKYVSHLNSRLYAPDPGSNRLPAENASVFEFFLCLSRACLGKMIIFSIKKAQKDA
jgi:hypothetical protein